MEPETARRAAEPFVTTKGVGGDTGLGLSMAQGLAAQSGGAMTIDSAPGAGTEVALWLPVAEAAAAPAPVEAARERRRLTVLVVDDDALVAMGAVAMLEDLGHDVLEADSGPRALEIVPARPEIDLVVTDHAMPGMTGAELARRLREVAPRLPILLATGYADLAGVADSGLPRISKPFRQQTLEAAIADIGL